MPQQVADDIHAFGVIWRESLQYPRFYAILTSERRWGYEFLCLQYHMRNGRPLHIHIVSHQHNFLSSHQQKQQDIHKEKQKRLFELLDL